MRLNSWLVVLALAGVAAYAIAEEITLTTYYPSPRGVYKELRTTDSTHLAIEAGNVGIGTNDPQRKLHVAGTMRLADGTQGNLKVLGSDADGNASWKTLAEATVCPNGYQDRTSYCIETNQRAAVWWHEAMQACSAEGATLCAASEYTAACVAGVLTNSMDDKEWLKDGTPGGEGCPQALTTVPDTCLRHGPECNTSGGIQRTFRCCMEKIVR